MTKQNKQVVSTVVALMAGGFVASSVTLPPLTKMLLVMAVITVVSGVMLFAWAARPAD